MEFWKIVTSQPNMGLGAASVPRRWKAGILVALSALTLCAVLAPSVRADTSTAPPQVVSLSYSPSSVDVTNGSAAVTFTAHLTDSSDIQSASIQLQSRTTAGQSVFAPPFSRISGTAQDGVWQTTVNLPQGAAAGAWDYSGSVSDAVNHLFFNENSYGDQGLPAAAPGPLTVTDAHEPPPSTSGAPSVSGSAVEGQTLSESHASWSGGPTSYSYQWQSGDGSGNNWSAIPGATGQSYTLTADDVGHTMRVQETATNAGGTSSPAVSTATATVLAAVPSTSGAPSVSGSAVEGQKLSESHASWTGSPTSYSYQWQSGDGSGNNWSAIPGATGQSYTLTADDVGHTMRVQETATNAGGTSSPAVSTATATVLAAVPSTSGAPSVSGSAVEGQKLSESHASWTGSPTSYSYQWQSGDGSGNNWSAIPGATGQSYTLTADDVGHTIRVQETATNAGGTSSPAVSTATATVLAAVPSTSGAPSVSGSAVEGQKLSESHASWTGSPTSYSYQWQSGDGSGNNWSAIPGATGQSYTLTADDVGHTIRVQETATNAGGTSSPAVSTATAVVEAPYSDAGDGGSGTGGTTTGGSGSGATSSGSNGTSASGSSGTSGGTTTSGSGSLSTGGSTGGSGRRGSTKAIPTFGPIKTSAAGARLSVACRGSSGSSCTLVLRLTVGKGKGATVVGSLSMRLAAGHRKTATIRPNGTAKRRLNQHHKLTVRFTVIQNRMTILQKVITFQGNPSHH